MMPTVRDLLPVRTAVVWTGLVLATLVSWFLGADHTAAPTTLAGVVILLVAFLKVRFVAAYFMEIRDAPAVLRSLVEGWCAIVCGAVLVTYLLA